MICQKLYNSQVERFSIIITDHFYVQYKMDGETFFKTEGARCHMTNLENPKEIGVVQMSELLYNKFNILEYINKYLLKHFSDRYLNDLYVLDIGAGHTLQWEMPQQYGTIPSPRESHTTTACSNPDGSKPRLIVYGGMSGCRLGDLYQLDIGKHVWLHFISCLFLGFSCFLCVCVCVFACVI